MSRKRRRLPRPEGRVKFGLSPHKPGAVAYPGPPALTTIIPKIVAHDVTSFIPQAGLDVA